MAASRGRAKRKVRYAVVGAGWISQEAFMPGVAHTGNSQMTAIVTGDPKKARALGKRYGIEHSYSYEDYDRMLEAGVADAIYNALPNTMHRDYSVRAMKAGLHVLCEKPLAPTEADCRAMIKAAHDNRVKLMTAYRLHFEPATLQALELVRRGRIGEPRIFASTFGQQVAGANHRTQADLWAGVLQDMGPYPINAVRHIFAAEPIEVVALSGRGDEPRFAEVDEAVSILLRFPGDRLASFTVSFNGGGVDEYRITGTKGDLLVQPAFLFGLGLKHRLTVGGRTSEKAFPAIDQFGAETKYFSECILEDREPEPDGEEGLADVRVILAVERALKTGRAQRLAPLERPRHPTPDQVRPLKPVKAPPLVNAKAPGEG